MGLLAKNYFKQAVAFESTESGRAAILRNAKLNGVSERLQVLGNAGHDLAAVLGGLQVDWSRAVVLMDVEGAEFELLNEAVLTLTRGASYVVELHDTFGADSTPRSDLVNRMAAHWHMEIVLDRARDWHELDALKTWHDLDRAVLLSEGRKIIGEWLVAEPKDQ